MQRKVRHEEDVQRYPKTPRAWEWERPNNVWLSIDEVLALEKGAQVEYLPNTQHDERTEGEECKVLNPYVGGFCVGVEGKASDAYYIGGWKGRECSRLVLWNLISRALRYDISSTISLTSPSSFRISVSSPDRASLAAIALCGIKLLDIETA